MFGDVDGFVNDKVKAALAAGLRPILCVGESLEERERGDANAVVEAQLRACLTGVTSAGDLAVAYEPVWAIGTGKAATPDIAQDVMSHVRSVLTSIFGDGAAAQVSQLYGGSVNAGNVADYMAQRDINGALVGGASLQADSFAELVSKAAAAGNG